MPVQIEIINEYPALAVRPTALRRLARAVMAQEGVPARSLSIILVDDPYLRRLHRDFLNDDSVTDVMTFDLGEPGEVEGEIYISVDRARDHAAAYGASLAEEIGRLIIHGILHLNGWEDHTPAEQKRMRELEAHYLHLHAGKIAEFLR